MLPEKTAKILISTIGKEITFKVILSRTSTIRPKVPFHFHFSFEKSLAWRRLLVFNFLRGKEVIGWLRVLFILFLTQLKLPEEKIIEKCSRKFDIKNSYVVFIYEKKKKRSSLLKTCFFPIFPVSVRNMY